MSPPLRRRLPFGLRVSVLRLPALARWGMRPTACLPRAHPVGWFTQARRQSPLRRQGTAYEPTLQAAKEHNIRRVVDVLDGLELAPGATFSWHEEVGPPLRLRGFAEGPELHDGRLRTGGGGGVCQVANLVYWLGVHGGLEVVERHRHALDLFADSDRDVPFGCGATVFWPTADLRLHNPHAHPVVLRLALDAAHLSGSLQCPVDPGFRIRLVETDHRFERAGTEVFRHNRLWREWGGGATLRREPLAVHRARVCYPVPPSMISSELP